MVKVLLVACLSGTMPGAAQLVHAPLTAHYLETGAYSRHFTDVFSITGNPATLSQVKAPEAGVYSERRYLLKELQVFEAVATAPFAAGGAAVTASYSGFAGYNESQAGIAYGRSLGEQMDLGIRFDYHMVRIPAYGAAAVLGMGLGSRVHLTPQLLGGFHVYQPAGMKSGINEKERLPAVYTAGLGYEASGKLFLSAVIGKEANQPVNITAAVHYAFIPQFFVRMGIASATGSFFTGTGLSWKQCRMDLSATYHPQLGITPALLFIFHSTPNPTPQE